MLPCLVLGNYNSHCDILEDNCDKIPAKKGNKITAHRKKRASYFPKEYFCKKYALILILLSFKLKLKRNRS